MKKKFLALVLALAMTFSISTTAFAGETTVPSTLSMEATPIDVTIPITPLTFNVGASGYSDTQRISITNNSTRGCVKVTDVILTKSGDYDFFTGTGNELNQLPVDSKVFLLYTGSTQINSFGSISSTLCSANKLQDPIAPLSSADLGFQVYMPVASQAVTASNLFSTTIVVDWY